MDTHAALASYFVAFMLTWHVVDLGRRRGRGYMATLALVRGLRLRHLGLAITTLVLTIAAYASIEALVPWTSWGWWKLLGGSGSVVFGQSKATQGPEAGPLLAALPFILPALLAIVVPTLARLEERGFRRGLQRASALRRARVQLTFGLLHMLMGVPVAAGLALALTGTLYLQVYLRRYRRTGSQGLAMLEATRAHVGTNLLVVAIVALGLAL
jgi:hypothetical protein